MYEVQPGGYDGDTFRVHAPIVEDVRWKILRTGYAAPDEEDVSPLQHRRQLSTGGPAEPGDNPKVGFDLAVDWALRELNDRYEGYRRASVNGVPWAILAPGDTTADVAKNPWYMVMGESGYLGRAVPAAVATPSGTEFRPYVDTADGFSSVDDAFVSLDAAVGVVTDRMDFRAPAAVTPGRVGTAPWLGEVQAWRWDSRRLWAKPMCWRGLNGAQSLEEAAAAAAGQLRDVLARCDDEVSVDVAGRLYRFGYGSDRLGAGWYGNTGGQMWEVSTEGALSRWNDPFRTFLETAGRQRREDHAERANQLNEAEDRRVERLMRLNKQTLGGMSYV